ncbi:MAG: AAA family ATPase [candidate division Zixibacteria bacterium]|nr:AAA family ATPase [candidate division Zixibacteria bacterium]MDH3936545.1 AAA family ATPase [candidate division Zixibacteria bacterium]MDH4032292.1 AAA family ATPase [candidate division Zixibacteria bacterium]
MSKQRLNLQRTAEPSVVKDTRLVSLLSGKGGVGKSVLAYNMAERLAFRGTRVLLVDLDVYCGNLHILANVACRYGVAQVVAGDLSLKEAVTVLGGTLDLLATDGRGWPEDMSSTKAAAHLATRLRNEGQHYDLILIDHPSGKCRASTVMAAASDINLLVVVPELTSIADACGLYKHLLETDRSLDCRLLVNRAQTDDEAEYIHQKLGALTERFYGRPPGYHGRLLEAESIRRAVAGQRPLSMTDDAEKTLVELEKITIQLVSDSLSAHSPAQENSEKAINSSPATADIRE